MRHPFWNKRVPAILSVLTLLLTVGTISWMSKNVFDLRGRAAPGETPKNIKITNITDTSFTVSYYTDDSVLGTIGYAQDPSGGQIGLDERDQLVGTPSPHRMHSITIQNLTPSNTYYFTIISGATNILDNDKPFTVNTAPLITDPPSNQSPLTGKVNLPDGNIPLEAIAYVGTSDSQQLSVLLKEDGGYILPINALRAKDLTSYASISTTTILNLDIVSPTNSSTATVLASQTNPVPLITLSQNYDFTVTDTFQTAITADNLSPSPASSSAGFGSLTQGETSTGASIKIPKEGETFTDQQPLFEGTAQPNENVDITIESTEKITTSIQADANGKWEFRPAIKLSPGNHTITIATKDITGVLQSISRGFTVYAQGSQFTEPSITPTASPSATITPVSLPTPTLTASPSATPIASATATPTIAPTVTPAINLTPTELTPTSSAFVTQAPLPPAGTSALILGGIMAFFSIVAGLMFFLL